VSKPRPHGEPWTAEEQLVVDHFARAIVEGRYRYVKEALPECQRELRRTAPAIRRTDVAVAWAVLCRAYDLGLPRRKHLWKDEELRLLERHASALARGEIPWHCDRGALLQGCVPAGRACGPSSGQLHFYSHLGPRACAGIRLVPSQSAPRPGRAAHRYRFQPGFSSGQILLRPGRGPGLPACPFSRRAGVATTRVQTG
jgi:hypothetical protein